MSNDSQMNCPACDAPLGMETVRHFDFPLRVCQACGLWSWSDRNPADYDTIYETVEYEEQQIDPLKFCCNPEEFLRHPTYSPFFREVPATAGSSLLDVGCGVGRFLVAARSAGWATRGIDVSKKAVEIGRNGAGLDLSCETLDQLQAAGERFDAITAFEVLEHVPQPVKLVKSALTTLNDGGWFFCTVPNRESPTVLKTRRPDWLPPVHLQFFTEGALRSLLQRAGGKNVRSGFVLAGSSPRPFHRKVRYVLKNWLYGARPDPLGIWAMAQRDDVSR